MTLTESEQARYDAFIAAARGFDAYSVGRALRELTPGIDWRGSKRTSMAMDFAIANRPTAPFRSLARVDLDRLRRMLLAKQEGVYLWQLTK